MNTSKIKLAIVIAFVVTSYITFILVAINVGFADSFIFYLVEKLVNSFFISLAFVTFCSTFHQKEIKFITLQNE